MLTCTLVLTSKSSHLFSIVDQAGFGLDLISVRLVLIQPSSFLVNLHHISRLHQNFQSLTMDEELPLVGNQQTKSALLQHQQLGMDAWKTSYSKILSIKSFLVDFMELVSLVLPHRINILEVNSSLIVFIKQAPLKKTFLLCSLIMLANQRYRWVDTTPLSLLLKKCISIKSIAKCFGV